MAQEDTSAAVTGQRHAAEHADVERRHADDHAQVSQRHLAAHEELYARHGSDHTLLASRHSGEREKAADATFTQKAALSARHGAQHVVMEVRHAAQLAWMDARDAGERLRMDQRHAAELLAQERLARQGGPPAGVAETTPSATATVALGLEGFLIGNRRCISGRGCLFGDSEVEERVVHADPEGLVIAVDAGLGGWVQREEHRA